MESRPHHGWNFPLARFLLGLTGRIYSKWRERHQHPFNFAVHLVGVPLAFAGLAWLILADWQLGLIGLVGGYVLQFVGHWVEGNDLGEWAAVKNLLGLPTVAISPRYRPEAEPITETHLVAADGWDRRSDNPHHPQDRPNYPHRDSR